jgi:hypothetical protein
MVYGFIAFEDKIVYVIRSKNGFFFIVMASNELTSVREVIISAEGVREVIISADEWL